MTAALNSPHEVTRRRASAGGRSAARGRSLTAAAARRAGARRSTARAAALRGELAAFGAADEVLRRGSRARLWRAVRDVGALRRRGRTRRLARLGPPSRRRRPCRRGRRACSMPRYFFDWGGGLVWLAVPAAGDGGAARDPRRARGLRRPCDADPRPRRAARRRCRCSSRSRPTLAALAARVKASFDPKRILNRGRMYSGI